MNDELVLTEIDPAGYAVLTLNRPSSLNALSRALMAELAQAVRQLEADPAVRVLILTGAGKAFCAGLDLKELGSGQGGLGVDDAVRGNDPVTALQPLTGRSHQLRVHLAAIGHPILGDALYAPPELQGGRLMLHADALAFEHPVGGHRLQLRCDAPF